MRNPAILFNVRRGSSRRREVVVFEFSRKELEALHRKVMRLLLISGTNVLGEHEAINALDLPVMKY